MKHHATIYNLLESVQYGFFYMVFAFLAGTGLDFLFPVFSNTIQTSVLVWEVTGQCMALIILTYFIRELIQSIPFLFPVPHGSGFKPYVSAEFEGEMMMGFVFLGVQLNLIHKIDLLAQKLYNWFFNEERVLQEKKKLKKKK